MSSTVQCYKSEESPAEPGARGGGEQTRSGRDEASQGRPVHQATVSTDARHQGDTVVKQFNLLGGYPRV